MGRRKRIEGEEKRKRKWPNVINQTTKSNQIKFKRLSPFVSACLFVKCLCLYIICREMKRRRRKVSEEKET